MAEFQVIRRIPVAEELRKIYDLPLEARVDQDLAAKNILEARRKRNTPS